MKSSLSTKLKDRAEGQCELCASNTATFAYAVSPKGNEAVENEVAVCDTCLTLIETGAKDTHWNCLAGSIWNTEPSVQALSYRILYGMKDQDWASEILSSVELDETVVTWAESIFQVAAKHVDSNGTELENGDTIVLTQQLNVKGASFMAPKGTIVRKIRLVPDNAEQIEGKINNDTIVILTKFVKKSV